MAITQARWGDAEHTFVAALNDGRPCTIPVGHRFMDEIEGAIADHEALPEAVESIADISARQFAQVLAIDGAVTEDEALAWAARGELPIPIETALLNIPEEDGQRFSARMLLASATTYERAHPMTALLGQLLGYDAATLDDIWLRAAAL